jgi:7-carboxy-7-deazaguanine synthase
MPDYLLVSEIFGPTVQGEGALAGQTSHFVRFAGCSYRCSWCDSMHAVDPDLIHKTAQRLRPDDIFNRLDALGGKETAEWVTMSGGDPVQQDIGSLIGDLTDYGISVAVETQGAFYEDWLKLCSQVTVSPKPPSSGMASRTDYEKLDIYYDRLSDLSPLIFSPKLTSTLNFKVVIFTIEDLQFAMHIHEKYPRAAFYLSVGTEVPSPGHTREPFFMTVEIMERYRWLVQCVLEEPRLKNVTVLPQLHSMLWGSKKGV